MSFRSRAPLLCTERSVARCGSVRCPSSPATMSSMGESTIARGVLSSWVMLAKKRDLKRSRRWSSSWAVARRVEVLSRARRFSSCSRAWR
jgi:hypothetical protein